MLRREMQEGSSEGSSLITWKLIVIIVVEQVKGSFRSWKNRNKGSQVTGSTAPIHFWLLLVLRFFSQINQLVKINLSIYYVTGARTQQMDHKTKEIYTT